MRVLHVEGLASHDGSESCAGIREGGGEALTGVHAGRVSSREKLYIRGADAVEKSGRQHGMVRYGEHCVGPARSSLRPLARMDATCLGTGRSLGRPMLVAE